MTMFMRLLRDIAQKHELCVLVSFSFAHFSTLIHPTTLTIWDQCLIGVDPPPQVLNDATAAGRPALGPSFTFMSDATLWLTRPLGQDRELRIAEVLRSRIWVCGCPYFSSPHFESIDALFVAAR
jgi:hypothetical protein